MHWFLDEYYACDVCEDTGLVEWMPFECPGVKGPCPDCEKGKEEKEAPVRLNSIIKSIQIRNIKIGDVRKYKETLYRIVGLRQDNYEDKLLYKLYYLESGEEHTFTESDVGTDPLIERSGQSIEAEVPF